MSTGISKPAIPCKVTNQVYATSVQPNLGSLQPGGLVPVTSTQAGLSYTWKFQPLDNGAFHIIAPTSNTGSNATEQRAVGIHDLLFTKDEAGSEDADPTVIQEWEVLSSARDGGATEPTTGKLKGWYIIAVRGEPKCVWILSGGQATTQVAVRDLFTADGPDQTEQQAYLNAQRDTKVSNMIWKPRKWLWYIDSDVKF